MTHRDRMALEDPRHLAAIAASFDAGPADKCWNWKGRIDRDGFGSIRFRIDGRRMHFQAHRLIYELNVGAIDEGLEVNHLCLNHACVNPMHLEPVRRDETMARLSDVYQAIRSESCVNGHPWTDASRYLPPDRPGPVCRICVAAAQRRYRARKLQSTIAPPQEDAA